MSNSEFSKPFPVDDDIIVKLPKGTHLIFGNTLLFDAGSSALYTPTKELADKVEKPLRKALNPQDIFEQGVKIEILEPGKQWTTGKFRCRLVFEFIPDEQENTKIPSEAVSPLDDIRKMNL